MKTYGCLITTDLLLLRKVFQTLWSWNRFRIRACNGSVSLLIDLCGVYERCLEKFKDDLSK